LNFLILIPSVCILWINLDLQIFVKSNGVYSSFFWINVGISRPSQRALWLLLTLKYKDNRCTVKNLNVIFFTVNKVLLNLFSTSKVCFKRERKSYFHNFFLFSQRTKALISHLLSALNTIFFLKYSTRYDLKFGNQGCLCAKSIENLSFVQMMNHYQISSPSKS
jgi:hypothetical protein